MTTVRLMSESQLQWAAGTVGTPVANAAYAVWGLTPTAEYMDMIEGSAHVGSMQRGHSRKGKRYTGVGFTSRLRGAHTSDQAPPEGAPLRACGFSENSGGTGSGNLAYTYILANQRLLTDTPAGALDPIDLTHNVSRLERILKDCVGNVRLELVAGEFGLLHFEMAGTVDTGEATDAKSSAAEANLEAQTDGSAAYPWQNSSLTIKVGSDGAVSSLLVPSFEINAGNKIVQQPDGNGVFGVSAARLAGRLPTATIQVRADEESVINFEDAAAAESIIEIKGTINPSGGVRQMIKFGWRGYIQGMPQPEDADSLGYYPVTMEQSETSGDELWISWESDPEYTYPF